MPIAIRTSHLMLEDDPRRPLVTGHGRLHAGDLGDFFRDFLGKRRIGRRGDLQGGAAGDFLIHAAIGLPRGGRSQRSGDYRRDADRDAQQRQRAAARMPAEIA